VNIDSDELHSALDRAVMGLGPGESATLRAHLVNGAFEGKTADVTVTLTAVGQHRLPDADDTFASLAGGFHTLAELRDDLCRQLTQVVRTQRLHAVREQVLTRLVAAADIPAPTNLVQDEAAHRGQWIVAELQGLGTSLEEHLADTDRTDAQLRAAIHQAATERTRRLILLDTIADVEAIQVSDAEISEEATREARRTGVSPGAYHSPTALATLRDTVRRGKALAQVLRQITITDGNGAVLTFDDLRDAPHPRPVSADPRSDLDR
jgi:trigger factor